MQFPDSLFHAPNNHILTTRHLNLALVFLLLCRLIFQELLFMKELSGGLLLAVLAAGQVGVWVYDRAYEYVQVHIWNKFRGKLLN